VLSYRELRARACAALDSEAREVVLRFASPGGDVWGAFDTARAIRAAADAAGKKLIAFVEGQCCSAAYALAAVCHEIVCTDTAVLGSIGVIEVSTELSRQIDAAGVRVTVITSGARKADGHPAVPVTDEARAAMQARVDAMAEVFFEHCAAHRPQLGDPSAFAAGVRVGRDAVASQLADRVATLDELLAVIDLPTAPAGAEAVGVKGLAMAKAKSNATREALVAAIGDDSDKEQCARAKRALAAYDGDDEPAAAAEPEPKEEPKEEPVAAASAEPSDEEKEKAKAAAAKAAAEAAPAAARAAAPSAAEIARSVADEITSRARAEAAAAAVLAERTALYTEWQLEASSPLRATLDRLPVAEARTVLAAVPKPKTPFVNPAVGTPRATVGAGQGAPALADAAAQAQLDRAFNTQAYGPSATHSGSVSTFSVVKGAE
jgi:ClpP class serine protease